MQKEFANPAVMMEFALDVQVGTESSRDNAFHVHRLRAAFLAQAQNV